MEEKDREERKEEIQEKVEEAVHGILKVKKAFIVGLSAALVIVTLITGGAAVYANIDLADYSNNNQISEIAQALDCDTSYVTQKNKKYVRMEHNGDEPIYVCFDKELNDKEKESAIKALDFMFGIVGQINPKYRYEIVDLAKYKRLGSKTKIYYTLGSEHIEANGKVADAHGSITRKYSWLSFLTNKRTTNDFVITIDRERAAQNIDYVNLHELAHAFSCDDVFSILLTKFSERHQANTILHPAIGEDIVLASPNDVKIFISLYAPKFKNDSEKQEFLTKQQQNLAAYEEFYYHAFAQHCKDNYYVSGEFQQKDFVYKNTIHYTATPQYNPTHHITLEGEHYTLQIFNNDEQLIDSAEGEVIWVDGIAILKEVRLSQGLKPGIKNSTFPDGYVQDLALVKQDRFAGLVDLNADASYTGRITYLENESEKGI